MTERFQQSTRAEESLPSEQPGLPTQNAGGSHGTRRRWALLLGAIGLAFAVVLWARAHAAPAETDDAANRPARDVPYLDGSLIRFSEGFAERNQLKIATIQTGSLSPVVHVTGVVTFDPDKVAAIGARITGRVRNVFKLEGAHVKAGDVLAEIESAELGSAQAALISARARAGAAVANERREKELAKAKISSARDAELAEATAASARADLLAAEGRVRAMGGRPNGEPGILLLQSPIEGKLVERKLWRGQFVEPTL
ncbi:MAG: hypothetical protein RL701_3814, partial [Pseudomonadota bacterium]